MLLKTEAIVIKTLEYGEADKIITFFSQEYGKIQGIAKGVRKIKARQGGKLELFTRATVMFFQKLDSGRSSERHPLLRITQVDVIEHFPQLRTDFYKIIGASYIAEFLNRTFEPYDSTHQAVYPLVYNTFRTLAAQENLQSIIPAFELKLLAHLGYAPVLDHCVKCGRPRSKKPTDLDDGEAPPQSNHPIGFSSSSGGIVCPRCRPRLRDSITLSSETVAVLDRFLHTHMPHVAEISLTSATNMQIKALLTEYIQYHLGISLKTEAFVQKLRMANLSS